MIDHLATLEKQVLELQISVEVMQVLQAKILAVAQIPSDEVKKLARDAENLIRERLKKRIEDERAKFAQRRHDSPPPGASSNQKN